MKVLATADIHQAAEKWEQLVKAVGMIKPAVVVIAGDLLPKDEGTLAQPSYMPLLEESALSIKKSGSELVLILGNDDNQLIIPEMEKGDRDGLWHYVADRVRKIGGYYFCGCPWIRDYPFAYKYWVAPDCSGNTYISPLQLGPPLLIDENNKLQTIEDFEAYLKAKKPISEILETTAAGVSSMHKSIWLIHEPPDKMGFDLCASGEKVGSPVVHSFIAEKQPLLTVHGHIHEAPRVNGGVWAGSIGRTVSIQAGQLDDALYYTTLSINDGNVENLFHSIYGGYVKRFW